jgi:energy-coupling factor transporter ATP-binding protein EcfA2
METPDQEKINYVESIIKLLELEDIQDALIGVPGAGLTIEQRKRLTIGVELAAKPSILLFLDEPTSGLDGQSSFNIVRFLRRLTAAGQAVLCTIHQPSASLFESFDTLLLLAKGGQTVYFGETGKDSSILLDYFSENGAPCEPDVNPAEHIINVVSGSAGGGRDWHSVWLESPEHTRVVEHMAEIKADALSKPSTLKIDDRDFATPLWTQLKLVTARQKTALWRNPTYVWNKFFLHISSSLFAGFTFWKLGNSASDLQLTLLACFNFLFVAIGVIAQLQPLFMHYRDIFEAREKKVSHIPPSHFELRLTAIKVKNVQLGCFRQCPTHCRDAISRNLRNPLLRLLVFHHRPHRRRFHLRPGVFPDDPLRIPLYRHRTRHCCHLPEPLLRVAS